MEKDKDQDFEFVSPGKIRTRFAPSPTGYLHVGGARTALFNYLFSKKHRGSFILRIEDTDPERSKLGLEKDIMDSLKWLRIEWDEGPDIGGEYGPYRQSKRISVYTRYLKKLLEENKAYYCFCSPKDREAQKQYLMSIGKPPVYNGKCRHLPPEKVSQYLKEGKPSVIRFKTPIKKIIFKDLVRGEIEFDSSLIGDFVIARSLTSPLYNFACAVDDFEMKISHVIRGEEHISNTPKQILLQEALGFYTPQYAHLPMILAPDRSKLSKRHGAVGIRDYKVMGYLPEALVNFMVFLGWNPGTEREIYSLAGLIKDFSLERIKKAGAVFNIKRLDFLNGFYIRQKPPEKITQLCIPYLIEQGFIQPVFVSETYPPAFGGIELSQKYEIIETKKQVGFEYLVKIISLYQERLKKLSEIGELVDFFFKKEISYPLELLKWKEMTKKEVIQSLQASENTLENIEEEDWNKEKLTEVLISQAEEFAKIIDKKTGDRGYLLWPLRVALTGKKASASPFEVAEILGKEKTLKRIKRAKQRLLEAEEE